MDNIEQENRKLHEEVSALKAGMANLTALMESLVAAQNQPPIVQPQQTMVTTEALTVPVSATLVVVQNRMPPGYPWGMPENFIPEGFNQDPQIASLSQTTATPAPLVVHITPAARKRFIMLHLPW